MKTTIMFGVLGIALAIIAPLPAKADYKVVAAGQRVKMDTLSSLDPTCRSLGTTDVNLITAPQGGQVETVLGHEYPYYAAANVRAVCDKRRVPVTMIYNRASPGFSGSDSFDAEVLFPDGTARRVHYTVQVR